MHWLPQIKPLNLFRNTIANWNLRRVEYISRANSMWFVFFSLFRSHSDGYGHLIQFWYRYPNSSEVVLNKIYIMKQLSLPTLACATPISTVIHPTFGSSTKNCSLSRWHNCCIAGLILANPSLLLLPHPVTTTVFVIPLPLHNSTCSSTRTTASFTKSPWRSIRVKSAGYEGLWWVNISISAREFRRSHSFQWDFERLENLRAHWCSPAR